MHNEHLRSRRLSVATLSSLAISATVYDAGRRYRTERAARAACLVALLGDLAGQGGELSLVIEQDYSLVSLDNQRMIEAVRERGCRA